MASVRFNVKTEAWKGLERQGKDFIDLTQKQLDRISKAALVKAEELIQDAEYDGDPDDATIYRDVYKDGRWVIVMKGPAALAIEFGASRKRDHWVFTANGRNIRINTQNGKKLSRNYQKVLRPAFYTKDGQRFRYQKGEAPRASVSGLGDKSFYQPPGKSEDKKHVNVYGREMTIAYYRPFKGESDKGYVKVYNARKDQPYYTEGNPPNRIMEKTFTYISDNIDRLAKGRK